MKTWILLGAPGAGKGTVAEMLVQEANVRHVSTGDMLRSAIKAGTPVGLEARGYMERGELVPDKTILDLVGDLIRSEASDRTILFDGFPRTKDQAAGLDLLLAGFGGKVDAVFQLDVPEALLIDRLAGRRVCRACGAVYHIRNIPTRVDKVCDKCGGEVIQRPDDTEETVRNRLAVYARQTLELIAFYRERGVLFDIAAGGPRQETLQAVLRAAASHSV
ncbi:MAG: adenylate kinase [Kiritimatiellia bacterium]|nr:adenylate kinase [Kiritimatiellia bacterium]